MPTDTSKFTKARTALRFTDIPNYGNVLFVDSVNGSSTGGLSPDTAAATLIQAQTLATASQQDVVYVAPGHAETVTGAAGMTFSKAGIRYQGLGHGRMRPTITFSTSTAAQIIFSAANVTFNNFIFDLTGIDAIVAAISVTAADVAFEDCEFILQSSTASPAKVILTAATATRFRVERCRFLGLATTSGGTLAACISHEVGVDFLIRNCYFRGKMTQAILNAATILGGNISDNHFHIYTGTKAIALASGTTGVGYNNRITVPSGTAPVVGAGFSWAGNIYTTEALTIGTPTAGAF